MKVKICANKNVEEAKMCLDAGADFLGVLVGQRHASNDFISKEQAKEIAKFVGTKAKVVLVTHLENAKKIVKLANFIGCKIIQLHSNIKESEVEKNKKCFAKCRTYQACSCFKKW